MAGIVVGVDGSPQSLIALDWALTESGLRQSPLTVLAVSPVATNVSGLAIETYPGDEQSRVRVQQATQDIVDRALSAHSGPAPAAVSVRAVTGIPAAELINASEEADLLVVGARGMGGFARLVLGSVSSQVSHHARCPVVIVPGDLTR